MTRPGTLPSRPDGRPDFAGNRPGGRPSTGDVGDFLGIGRPIDPGFSRPTRPGGDGGLRPERPTRPDQGGGGTQWKPEHRPDHRPGNRPGNRPDWDHNFNNRPDWVHIGDNNFNNINNQWNTAIGNRPGMNNWIDRHPDRWRHYNNWGNNVHNHWNHWNNNWFRPGWWDNHSCWRGGWNYWGNRPWGYWWTVPAWGAVTGWFNNWGWNEPVYYDYGSGGNVVYEGDTVYVNGESVGTPADMAMSAAELSTVPAPESQEVADQSEWLALGTFAVSTNTADNQPSRMVQLAVNKEGIISGTLFNTETDQATGIQGKVDKQTQRVAMRIGETGKVVAETGIYNLTQKEAPLLVHFGTEKSEQMLLVRLDAPEDAENQTDGTQSF